MTDTRGLGLGVSNVGLERLKLFAALVDKWNPRINLVSKASVADMWARHIEDSVQVFHVKQSFGPRYADLGSGGGFPGIVCAILIRETNELCEVTLVESDTRKATFLRTASRELELNITVISKRIEEVPPLSATTITARALTSLSGLCHFATKHLDNSGTALFPKGNSWEKEVEEARESWHFDLISHASTTQPQSRILEIGGIRRVQASLEPRG